MFCFLVIRFAEFPYMLYTFRIMAQIKKLIWSQLAPGILMAFSQLQLFVQRKCNTENHVNYAIVTLV